MAKPKIYWKKPRKVNTLSNGLEDQNSTPLGQLWLYYSYGGKSRLEYYTGYRIEEKYFNAEYWNSVSKKPIKNNFIYSVQYNSIISEMKAFIVSLVVEDKIFDLATLKMKMDVEFKGKLTPDQIRDKAKPDFIEYIEQVIAERKSGKRTLTTGNRKGMKYAEATFKIMGSTLLCLKKFKEHYKLKRIEFKDINLDFYGKLRTFEIDIQKNNLNTFSTRIKDIKAFMNEALYDQITTHKGHQSKRFIKPDEEADTVALTMDQIKAIKDAELPESLSRIRDLFLIGCYSGLRFSDYNDFEKIDIDGKFIRLTQQKTNNKVTIPIMKDLLPILQKYNQNMPKPMGNGHFNKKVKELIAHKNVGIDYVYDLDEDEGPIMFSEKVTSHTGRRSYATNMFKLGVPALLIMSATGHKKESSFLRYIKATNEEKAFLLAEQMKRLDI